METNRHLQLFTFAAFFIALCAIGGVALASIDAEGAESPPRIGIYDSRSVATAYCGTSRHEAQIQRLDEALKAAQRSGDTARIRQADNAIWDARKRLHRQGLGTHPVDDILAQIPEELSRLKKEFRVVVLASKWDDQTLAQHQQAEKVDVTKKLIEVLKAKERQRRNAIEIQKQKPVPAIMLELMLMMEGAKSAK